MGYRGWWATIVRAIEGLQPVYERANAVASLLLGPLARRRGLAAARLACPRPRVVVDVGVGFGYSLEAVEEYVAPAYLVGVEPSPAMAAVARRRVPLGDVVVAVAEALPLRSGCCGLATAFYSVRDFRSPGRGLAEMVRVADCVLVVDVFNPSNPVARLVLRLWVCLLAPLLVSLAAPGLWRLYRGMCVTLAGWARGEAVAKALSRLMPVLYWSTAMGSIAVVLGVGRALRP